MEAPNNVLYDEDGREFIFRQPRNEPEVQNVVMAACVDPFQAYRFDGLLRWDIGSIQAWWHERRRLIEWIQQEIESPHFDQMDGLREFEYHLIYEAEHFLKSFIFVLDTGRLPTKNDRLPAID